MTDPYCWPDTDCLRNKLDIRDAVELREIESRIVSARDVELVRMTLPGEYNLEHLKRFHARLFGDVYDWAGETRAVNVHKSGTTFAAWQIVDEYTSSILGQLEFDSYLIGRRRGPFIERLAYYYSELNAVHPFRESNGRTQRAFLRQLAAAAGWRVDWSSLSTELNIAISSESFHSADTATVQRAFTPLISQI
ncbi:MAG: Fic/DOC family protein [Pseudonocardia sp.]